MATTPDASAAAAWLLVLLTGALAGAVGQLVRAIAGMGKANQASASGQPVEPFSASRLVVSMLVGATAGALAALGMHEQLTAAKVEVSSIMGLMAAGYAGADFIEGVAGKFFPTTHTTSTLATTAVQLKAVNTLSDGPGGAVG
jgi:hypothetical protein